MLQHLTTAPSQAYKSTTNQCCKNCPGSHGSKTRTMSHEELWVNCKFTIKPHFLGFWNLDNSTHSPTCPNCGSVCGSNTIAPSFSHHPETCPHNSTGHFFFWGQFWNHYVRNPPKHFQHALLVFPNGNVKFLK